MDKRILVSAIALIMMAGILPANAYHIDGNASPAAGFTSADFDIRNPNLILCESNGQNDDRNWDAAPHQGFGGMCTTGRNDASGEPKPAAAPGRDEWTRLDVCDALTLERNPLPGGPYAAGGNDCASAQGPTLDQFGYTNQHGFFAEIGIYGCFVPTDNTTVDAGLGALATLDYALYYEEMYAWWSYDNGGPFDPMGGDPAGTAQNGGMPVDPTGEQNPLGPPGTGITGMPIRVNEDAYHGHVAVWPDPTESKVQSRDRGSAETADLGAAPPWTVLGMPPLEDNPAGSPAGGLTHNCGSSPANTTSSNSTDHIIGPVVRYPNTDNIANGTYILSSTVVAAIAPAPELDPAGAVVCTASGNIGLGGNCVPFGVDAIEVDDLVSGLDVAFQVCVDHNQDNLCTDGLIDPMRQDCREMWYSEELATGINDNPMNGPAPGGRAAGCPDDPLAAVLNGTGLTPYPDGYVVFVCEGVHVISGTPHTHVATVGTVSSVASVAGNDGHDSTNGFCGPPPGLPTTHIYTVV